MFPSRLLAFAAAGLLALFVGHSFAQPKKPPVATDSLPVPPEKEAMKEKRTRAHAVLDALTAGDPDALRRNAEVLSLIADMRVFVSGYKTEEYRYQAKVFKHAADDLVAAAKAKNMDAAALAYADMTRTCVKCHTHFRGVKD
ncbi:MAG: cytochrome c [Planctomycetes bacterium]|nr:cytochrome c [Planctomycetota bacterium]